MLLMVLSPMQVSLASDAEPHEHANSCSAVAFASRTAAQLELNDCAQGYEEVSHEESCIDHPGCVIQFNLSTLQSSDAFLLLANKAIRLRLNSNNDAFSTRYLDLPRRPPKA